MSVEYNVAIVTTMPKNQKQDRSRSEYLPTLVMSPSHVAASVRHSKSDGDQSRRLIASACEAPILASVAAVLDVNVVAGRDANKIS
jgi:hypothetical protein